MEGLPILSFLTSFRFFSFLFFFFSFMEQMTGSWFFYLLASGMPDLPLFALRPLLDLCLYWSSLFFRIQPEDYLDPHV